MKKIVAGIGFEITGVVMVLFSALITSSRLEWTTSWNTRIGRYWQTAIDFGLLPVIVIGAVLLAVGIGFCLWGVFSKQES